MILSGTSLTWNGVTVLGDSDDGYTLNALEGWEELPEARVDYQDRPGQHGAFDSPVWSGARRVMAAGLVPPSEQRDAKLAELRAAFVYRDADTLSIDHAGRSLTARARLVRFRAQMDLWGAGAFTWAAEWICADPLRYGTPLTVTTGFPVQRGGLRYPLYTDGAGTVADFLDYGEAPDTGVVTLVNEGTAESWPIFEVTGPVPDEGFELVEVGTGRRVVFAGPVADGSSLVLDAAQGAGSAVIDGTAERGGSLTVLEWFPVPARGSTQVAFLPLGASSSASLSVSFSPAWW